MMQQCLQWPGKNQLKDVLKQTFDQNDVDLKDTIFVNQWLTRIGQNFWICNVKAKNMFWFGNVLFIYIQLTVVSNSGFAFYSNSGLEAANYLTQNKRFLLF